MNHICNMQQHTIQAILGGVEKPSRYIGTEINRVRKDPDEVNLRMILAFPDLYEIGTSHFGLQILYHLMNRHPEISAERVFAPAGDMERALRDNGMSLFSLETRTPLRQFHILGFSLLYELNFTNVLNMLEMAEIPLYADQRDDQDPLVIAGGPCVANPEPMAPFFDAMVFGDGEHVLPEMAEIWLNWKKEGGQDRNTLLANWAQLEGVYIPSLFKAEYDPDGFQHLMPLHPEQSCIRRTIVADLDSAFFPQHPIIPFGKPIHDRLRLEISRGCSRGCRFCQAGMIYRPVRERSIGRLLDIAEKSLAATGYEDLSLLSLSTGDYSGLSALIGRLMQRCRMERTAVSLPSIRAGTLTPEVMEQIKTVRKTGFTIAPEAGSQRLRDVINKNVSFEDIKATVTDAFALGWKVIKLYFMLGLPTETDEDLDAIVHMVHELRKIKSPGKRKGQINVSFSTFIPKSHTPFQWASQIGLDQSRAKIDRLKVQLRLPGVQVKWQHPAMSLLEGVIARGDRRLAGVIEHAFRSGCRFDGWSDHFDFERWKNAFTDRGLSLDFFTTRPRSFEEPLPWAHMDSRVNAEFLRGQMDAALRGATLDDCRHQACYKCGVCDFKALEPMRFGGKPVVAKEFRTAQAADAYQAVALTYSKRHEARFFGHLEVANIFARALRRAKIDVLYSQGFHPMPRISFNDPLPLGMESCGERMVIRVAANLTCKDLKARLSSQLPHGFQIIDCQSVQKTKVRVSEGETDHYHVFASACLCTGERIESFQQQAQWSYNRRRKDRCQNIDLKSVVTRFERIAPETLALSICRKAAFSIRPHDVLRAVFDMDDQQLALVRVLKLGKGIFSGALTDVPDRDNLHKKSENE